MLRRPIPWLVRTVPALDRRARGLRSRVLHRIVRAQLGDPIGPAGDLASHLVRAAGIRLGGGLAEVVAANLRAHGIDRVGAAALEAVGRLEGSARGRLARAAARRLEQAGQIARPLEILAAAGESSARLALHQRLLAGGITPGEPLARTWTPVAGRVLYHASQSLPHHSSGYAIRTHWLVRTLRDKGWDVSVATRLGYPNDRYEYFAVNTVAGAAGVDGVSYRFSPTRKQGIAALDIASYQAAASAAVIGRAGELRPSIIHSASNHPVGLAGCDAARRLGIPSIYEVRGLWHLTRASEHPGYLDSDHYRMIDRLEAQAAGMADHVFVITRAVADILVGHGVAAGKISILPNAVDVAAFAARGRDQALAARWGLGAEPVIGYVGTFKQYEGLDLLLQAAARLRRQLRFRVLLVGDGPVHADLLALVKRLGLGDLVVFTGRAPHERIQDYYGLIDVMAFPRTGARVCEVVSPLKPFEAMAMGVPMVASDVGALAEIVEDGVTGLLHRRDDIDSLSRQLARMLEDPALRRSLADSAATWVREHRSWSAVADHVIDVYRRLAP
jgi:glycosyltransferase involved in cell wall biosynthesis